MRRPGTRNRAGIERDADDFYPTPAWVTLALLDLCRFEGSIADPCCGDGEIIIALRSRLGSAIRWFASDLVDHGFGHAGRDILEHPPNATFDNVVTNPPYGILDRALPVLHGMGRRKVALFMRSATHEAASRHAFLTTFPPSLVMSFTERVTMYSRRTEVIETFAGRRLGNSSSGHSWYVWDKEAEGAAGTRLLLIPPGRKHVYRDISMRIRKDLNRRYAEEHGLR